METDSDRVGFQSLTALKQNQLGDKKKMQISAAASVTLTIPHHM